MAKEYIFQWSFKSAKEVEGRRAVYEVLLSSEGALSCSCPAWIFPKSKKLAPKDKNGNIVRSCKHTELEEIQSTYKSLHKKWFKGEPLPKIANHDVTTAKDTSNYLQFGRLVELD